MGWKYFYNFGDPNSLVSHIELENPEKGKHHRLKKITKYKSIKKSIDK